MIVVTGQVEHPVDHIERQFVVQRHAETAGLHGGAISRDDNFPVLERDNIRRPPMMEEPFVDARDFLIGDENKGEIRKGTDRRAVCVS